MKNDYALKIAQSLIEQTEPYKGFDERLLVTALKPNLDRHVARNVEQVAVSLAAMERMDAAVSRGDRAAFTAALDHMERNGVSGFWFAVGRQLFQERHGYDPHPSRPRTSD